MVIFGVGLQSKKALSVVRYSGSRSRPHVTERNLRLQLLGEELDARMNALGLVSIFGPSIGSRNSFIPDALT